MGTRTRKLRIMNCIALIMPHNCCIEPPIISEMMKLPDERAFTRSPPASVVDPRLFDRPSSIIGGIFLKIFEPAEANPLISIFFKLIAL